MPAAESSDVKSIGCVREDMVLILRPMIKSPTVKAP